MRRYIDSLGRIVIPVEMRRTLEVSEGDPVDFKLVDDKIIISNPNRQDEFENYLMDYILRTESSEAKNILVKYQELKK